VLDFTVVITIIIITVISLNVAFFEKHKSSVSQIPCI
jgi:hypothetical protein